MARRRVLVIDDDPGILQLLGRIFQRANYEVHLAESGPAGLSQVDDVQPDPAVLKELLTRASALLEREIMEPADQDSLSS